MIIKTTSREETEIFAKSFAKNLKKGDIVTLFGPMGAGKTAFVSGLSKGLECTERVSSPTFAIVNEYPGAIPLFHFDLYRLNGADDLYDIGFYDYLDRGGICAIEWSERLGKDIPDDAIKVTINMGKNENERIIEIAEEGKI